MSILRKNKVLTDKYVPAVLPSEGLGLENFVPSNYPHNDFDLIKAEYSTAKKSFSKMIPSCDRFSTGDECDEYIEAQNLHNMAVHEASVANHENQLERLHAALVARKAVLKADVTHITEKVDRLKADIEQLKDLQPQFEIRLGKFSFSAGTIVTILAMIVDAAVNFYSLQSILFANVSLLVIYVLGMSFLSDGCMAMLASYINHRGQNFVSKFWYWFVCCLLFGGFLASVVVSALLRFGSMDQMYGTINAAGEVVGKEVYSLAEYGLTLLLSSVTTATGIASFGLSLDKNLYNIGIRKRKEGELKNCLNELSHKTAELTLLENAPDYELYDRRKRAAAEHQLEAINVGLKLQYRKLLCEYIKDPDFTERLSENTTNLMANRHEELILQQKIDAIHLDKVS